MRSLRQATPFALILLARQLLLIHDVAWAVPTDCDTPDGHHVGKVVDSSEWEARGAQAIIYVRDADLCISDDSESNAWSMLRHSEGTGYAQIGYLDKNWGTEHRFFWEWVEGGSGTSGLHTGIWGTPTLNQSYNFKVSRYPADGLVRLLLGFGSTPPCNQANWCPVTDFDPVAEWPDVWAQFDAETEDGENDIVGSASSRARFLQVEEKDPADDWDSHPWTGTFDPDLCYYHLNTIDSSTSFEVWTAPEDHVC